MPRGVVGAVFVLVIIALTILLGIGALDAQSQAVIQPETKVNETFVPPNATETYSVVEDSVGNYSDTVTVRDENDTEMTAGTDYEWNRTVGNLTVTNGSRLINDSNATITYDYGTRSAASERAIAFTTTWTQILPPLVLIVGVVVVLFGLVRAFG